MNLQAIRILFLKDLFLSRRHLFAYFVGGLAVELLIMTVALATAFLFQTRKRDLV